MRGHRLLAVLAIVVAVPALAEAQALIPLVRQALTVWQAPGALGALTALSADERYRFLRGLPDVERYRFLRGLPDAEPYRFSILSGLPGAEPYRFSILSGLRWSPFQFLRELPADERYRLLSRWPADERYRFLGRLSADERYRFLGRLSADERYRFLSALSADERQGTPVVNRPGLLSRMNPVSRTRIVAVRLEDTPVTIRGIKVRSGLIVGRQTDIDAVVKPAQGLPVSLGEVPKHLLQLSENRLVILIAPQQAARVFNRLTSPSVKPILVPYSEGTIPSSACGFCTPTAAVGYGGGRISFSAGCRDGVMIEVSSEGAVKVSKGPLSIAVSPTAPATAGADTDEDNDSAPTRRLIVDVVTDGPTPSLSVSAGCKNGVTTMEASASVTAAAGLKVRAYTGNPEPEVQSDDVGPDETAHAQSHARVSYQTTDSIRTEPEPTALETRDMDTLTLDAESSLQDLLGADDVGGGRLVQIDVVLAEWANAQNQERE